MSKDLYFLSKQILDELSARNYTVAFAESCTGGQLATLLTSFPGSSQVVAGSLVCYQLRIKQNVLGLSEVNEENVYTQLTATKMAMAAIELFDVDVGVATTGKLDGNDPQAYCSIVAPEKGTWEVYDLPVVLHARDLRATNRTKVVKTALAGLFQILN